MSITVFPAPVTSGGVDANGKWWHYPTANQLKIIDGPFNPGVYRFQTNANTMSVTIVSAAYLPLGTLSVGTTPVYYNLTSQAAQLQISSASADFYFNVTDLDEGTFGTPVAVTTVNASGNVTLNATLSKVVIIGGGAAALGSGTSAIGGGSGRFAQGDFGPGTYALTIGAGGTGSPGAAGGTTTFGNLSAAGGNGSSGGSGGGSGFRGNNGSGTGTGTFPDLRFPTASVGGNAGSGATFGGAGGGGGVYAGGGNGGYFANSPQTGGTGSAGGGGGGAGANAANGGGSPGSGGPGILYHITLEA